MTKRLTVIILLIASLAAFLAPESYGQVSVVRSRQTIDHDGYEFYLHTVKRGQTLYSISKAYDVSEAAIIEYNPFADRGIKTRQSLLIPTETTYNAWKSGQRKETPTQQLQQHQSVGGDMPDESAGNLAETGLPTEQGEEEIIVEIPQKAPFDGRVKPLERNAAVNVTMILPFDSPGTGTNKRFADFYSGALIALNSLKKEGISVNLDLVSSNKSTDEIQQLIDQGKLDKANLIIGPVYAEQFAPVAKFAAENEIPVVSPLGAVEADDNPYVFQVYPTRDTKYEKLRPLLNNPEANVIVMRHISQNDQAAYDEMHSVLPVGVRSIDYSKQQHVSVISNMLDRERENVIIIPVSNENIVEEMLSRLTSINMQSRYKISVIGTSSWANYNNLNLDMYFRLSVQYVTMYHADRLNPLVNEFYREYIGNFSALPTLYSFRGYDVTKYFIGALKTYGEFMPRQIEGYDPAMLQVKYDLRQDGSESKFVNRQWTVVKYMSNYGIEVY